MPSVLTEYWPAVAAILDGANPRHRSVCMRVSGLRPREFDGRAAVRSLLASVERHWPDKPATRTTNNWNLRREVPPFVTRSPEVALERTIAARASGAWFCQMSTASGIHGPASDKRRAIDLVHHPKDGHYRFIELKIGSDNPLYALFEALGYGLIYLMSRRSRCGFGYSDRDLMSAHAIEMTVLAPHAFFDYRRRGHDAAFTYDLNWLEEELSEGLQEVAGDDVSMVLNSVGFEPGSRLEDSAAAVIDLFERRVFHLPTWSIRGRLRPAGPDGP